MEFGFLKLEMIAQTYFVKREKFNTAVNRIKLSSKTCCTATE